MQPKQRDLGGLSEASEVLAELKSLIVKRRETSVPDEPELLLVHRKVRNGLPIGAAADAAAEASDRLRARIERAVGIAPVNRSDLPEPGQLHTEEVASTQRLIATELDGIRSVDSVQLGSTPAGDLLMTDLSNQAEEQPAPTVESSLVLDLDISPKPAAEMRAERAPLADILVEEPAIAQTVVDRNVVLVSQSLPSPASDTPVASSSVEDSLAEVSLIADLLVESPQSRQNDAAVEVGVEEHVEPVVLSQVSPTASPIEDKQAEASLISDLLVEDQPIGKKRAGVSAVVQTHDKSERPKNTASVTDASALKTPRAVRQVQAQPLADQPCDLPSRAEQRVDNDPDIEIFRPSIAKEPVRTRLDRAQERASEIRPGIRREPRLTDSIAAGLQEANREVEELIAANRSAYAYLFGSAELPARPKDALSHAGEAAHGQLVGSLSELQNSVGELSALLNELLTRI